MTGNVYIICDSNKNVLSIQGVAMMGQSVTISAIFLYETEALEVLYTMDAANIRGDNHIERVRCHLQPVELDGK